MNFIDLKKAYDRAPRKLIWRILRNKYIPNNYVDIIQDMYEEVTGNVRGICGETTEFAVGVGLYQGSALGPYMFALIMDDLTSEIQDEVPWCLLFADDIAEYMECNFSGLNDSEYNSVKIGYDVVTLCDKLRYLGFIVESQGCFDLNITNGIGVGWTTCRQASGI